MRRFFALVLAFLCICSAPAAAAEVEVDALMLVNKDHFLAAERIPEDLVTAREYFPTRDAWTEVRRPTAEALQAMYADMQAEGIFDVRITSAYRAYSFQTTLFNNKVRQYKALGYDDEEARRLAGTIVNEPGSSEHQLGYSADLSTATMNNALSEEFAKTPAGAWIAENCWKYGLIIRYPADKQDVTKIVYEAWHLRYVGQPHAAYITEQGWCLEEYIDFLVAEGGYEYSYDGVDYAVICNAEGRVLDAAGEAAQLIGSSDTNTGYRVLTLHLGASAPAVGREALLDAASAPEAQQVASLYGPVALWRLAQSGLPLDDYDLLLDLAPWQYGPFIRAAAAAPYGSLPPRDAADYRLLLGGELLDMPDEARPYAELRARLLLKAAVGDICDLPLL